MAITQQYCEQYWTSPGDSTLQNSSSTTTYHPSWKLSKLNEPNMQDIAGEGDKLISDILLWTPSQGQAEVGRPASTYIQQLCADTGCSLEDRWMIETGCKRGSKKSVLVGRHNDNDELFKIELFETLNCILKLN